MTVIKDKIHEENRFRRINVRKIISLDNFIKAGYNDVKIEIENVDDLKNLYETIKEKGNSKIRISIKNKDRDYLFELRDKRKFDLNTLKNLKKEPYIKKISV